MPFGTGCHGVAPKPGPGGRSSSRVGGRQCPIPNRRRRLVLRCQDFDAKEAAQYSQTVGEILGGPPWGRQSRPLWLTFAALVVILGLFTIVFCRHSRVMDHPPQSIWYSTVISMRVYLYQRTSYKSVFTHSLFSLDCTYNSALVYCVTIST